MMKIEVKRLCNCHTTTKQYVVKLGHDKYIHGDGSVQTSPLAPTSLEPTGKYATQAQARQAILAYYNRLFSVGTAIRGTYAYSVDTNKYLHHDGRLHDLATNNLNKKAGGWYSSDAAVRRAIRRYITSL